MSAFMHREETYNSIGNKLQQILYSNRESVRHSIDRALGVNARLLTPDEVDVIVKAFVETLYAQNLRSVEYRYREDTVAQSFYEFNFRKSQDLSIIGLFKLLESVDYQCCETPDYKELPMAIQLRAMIDNLARHIVSRLPEYEKAAWSIDV